MAEIIFNEKEQDYEKVIKENKDRPTFVDFNASWCGPCKALKPQLKKICKDNNFNFIDVDIDNNEEVAEKLEVQGVPYVVLYVKGEKVFDFTGNKKEKVDEAVEIAKK